MEQRIIKTDTGEVVIVKSHNDYNNPQTENDYYVVEWKNGHYELDDVIKECQNTIDAINHFKKANKIN